MCKTLRLYFQRALLKYELSYIVGVHIIGIYKNQIIKIFTEAYMNNKQILKVYRQWHNIINNNFYVKGVHESTVTGKVIATAHDGNCFHPIFCYSDYIDNLPDDTVYVDDIVDDRGLYDTDEDIYFDDSDVYELTTE